MNDVPTKTEECRAIEEHLSPYLDGMLDEETRARVEEHLRICGGCPKALEDLRVLVNEIGSLGTVPAPAGFLESVHERMKTRSRLGKVLQVLFFPIRVKIPLQLAAAATAGLLVFVVFQGIERTEEPLTPTEMPLILEKMERSASDSGGQLARQKAEKKRPLLGTAGVAEERKEDLIRLALLIEPAEKALEQAPPPDPAPTDRDKHALGEGPQVLRIPAPEETGKAFSTLDSEAPRLRRPPLKESAPAAVGKGPAPEEKAEKAETLPVYEPFTALKATLRDLGGRIKHVEYDQKNHRPRSLSAEIPLAQLDILYRKLAGIGRLETLPPKAPAGESGPVRIEIRFLYPD